MLSCGGHITDFSIHKSMKLRNETDFSSLFSVAHSRSDNQEMRVIHHGQLNGAQSCLRFRLRCT